MVSLPGFGIIVMMASWNELRSVPLSADLQQSFRKTGVGSSLNASQNLLIKLWSWSLNASQNLLIKFGPGLLFVGRFNITFSISVLVIGSFLFSLSFQFSLRLYIYKNLSIFSRLNILLAYSFLQQSHDPLHFFWYQL